MELNNVKLGKLAFDHSDDMSMRRFIGIVLSRTRAYNKNYIYIYQLFTVISLLGQPGPLVRSNANISFKCTMMAQGHDA